ncbi:MAG: HAMP domain-containing protein [Chitinophagales bacterium]|nr:HAMP domain-containing protein [Chitinophagales bacterium]MBP9704059.1 HAMP domain-containing protein [Chitinophagales bacterium]
MQIRQRLSNQFIFIVFIILLLFSIAIYILSANYRKTIFYERIESKAQNVANLLLEVDEIDAGLLRKIENANPITLPNENIIIFNYLNDTLFSSPDNVALQIDQTLIDNIRLEGEIKFNQGEYENIGFLFTSRYDRFVVIAGAIDVFGKQRLLYLRNVLIIAFSTFLIVLIFVGNLYARQALRPISNVIKQVKNISASSMNLRLNEGNSNDEIAQLSSTFNQMLHRLETAFSIQKNFIANASHEMRTPLTSITGQLEVLLLQNRSTEEYKKTIISVLEDIKLMNRTSDRLLMLAQASSEVTLSTLLPVRIDDIIWKARSELLKYNPEYNSIVVLDESLDATQMVIAGNEILLTTAVVNLMENSCKYSENKEAHLELKPLQNKIQLLFTDSGIGIIKSDLKNLTQPFYRGKNIGNRKGHGIGLSIVESIIKIHSGEMTITSELGKGTQIKVLLPLAIN